MANIARTNGNLVMEREGRAVTTSLLVASKFDKNHRDVLRGIKFLGAPAEFTERNFALSEYEDPTGRKLPMCFMTRDGFMLLVMGFTGKKAMAAKVAWIEAFNALERSRMVPVQRIEALVNEVVSIRMVERSGSAAKLTPNVYRRMKRYLGMDLTKKEAGKLLGVHHRTVQRWEKLERDLRAVLMARVTRPAIEGGAR